VGEEPLKVILTGLFWHKVRSTGLTTDGTGLTIMVKVRGVPEQVPAAGITVTVAVCGVIPVLVPTKFRLPVPEATNPTVVLLFVQLKTAPLLPANATPMVWPEQAVALAGCDTEGGGATVILKF